MRYAKVLSFRTSDLPVETLRQPIRDWFAAGGVRNAVVRSPTGSGKSTQVPQMLLDHGAAGDKQIVVLQPRRIAARMLAARVAKERGARLGDEVGYQVRFERVASANTRIFFVTEGVMLRFLHDDALLRKVGCLVIDEFHERHLDGDLCLAWAKAAQERARKDLRIVVMSATIAPGPLRTFLEPCEIFDSEGRTFPVETGYQAPLRDKVGNTEFVWDQAARAVEGLVTKPGMDGDVLIFMPGGHEIRKTMAALSGRSFSKGFRILPLHGELSASQQDEAVAPGGSRRIIVSTNVAETSLTIEGVKAVVDSGLARVAGYDQRRGINTLMVQKISRASADQRTGRAGRLGPGLCVRLWPEREHLHRAESELPEVKRLDLSEALLALAVVSEKSGLDFTWFEAPAPDAVERAVRLLLDLGAITKDPDDSTGRIKPTALGRQMTAFPLHPRFSRMLVTAASLGCIEEAALSAALAQGRDILLKPTEQIKRKQEEFFQRHDISEFQRLARACEKAAALNFDPQACSAWGLHAGGAREAMRTRDQLLRLTRGLTANEPAAANPAEALAKAVLSAFPDHLGAETASGSRVYELAGGFRGHLDKEAHAQPPPLLVAAEVAEIQGKALQVKLNLTTRVEEAWLEELFPGELTTAFHAVYDAVNRRVMNREETRFRGLTLRSRERGEPEAGLAATLLADEIIAGRLALPNWTEKHDQWITRLNCLAAWMPDLELPTIGEEDKRLIIEQMCLGAIAYRQIKDRTPDSALRSWLSASQHDLLDRYAPERLPVGMGKSARITYRKDAPPLMSAILQQLYDTKDNPKVAGGRVPVLVEILAPNQRPVQVTGDLANFWKNSYPGIKTQLKGRYPKHEWR